MPASGSADICQLQGARDVGFRITIRLFPGCPIILAPVIPALGPGEDLFPMHRTHGALANISIHLTHFNLPSREVVMFRSPMIEPPDISPTKFRNKGHRRCRFYRRRWCSRKFRFAGQREIIGGASRFIGDELPRTRSICCSRRLRRRRGSRLYVLHFCSVLLRVLVYVPEAFLWNEVVGIKVCFVWKASMIFERPSNQITLFSWCKKGR